MVLETLVFKGLILYKTVRYMESISNILMVIYVFNRIYGLGHFIMLWMNTSGHWLRAKVMGNVAINYWQKMRDKLWLKQIVLHTKIVLSKRFLNTFRYYTNFRFVMTNSLIQLFILYSEFLLIHVNVFVFSFHNNMLMYCPKRHSYS